MAEYTRAVDAQISQLLQQRGSVTPVMLAGVDPADGVEFLACYVQVHAHEVAFVFDGATLTWAQAVPVEPPAFPRVDSSGAWSEPPPVSTESMAGRPQPRPGAVDQILSAPPQGKSLLDFEPSGGSYPKWAWWPPLVFGLLGGLFSWFVVRDTNPRAAMKMLITGVVVQVVSGCIAAAALSGMQPALSQLRGGGEGAPWPPSQSQHASFYYFGTSS